MWGEWRDSGSELVWRKKARGNVSGPFTAWNSTGARPSWCFSKWLFSHNTSDVSIFLENFKLPQMVKCQASGDKQQEDLTNLGEWAEKRQMSSSKVISSGKNKWCLWEMMGSEPSATAQEEVERQPRMCCSRGTSADPALLSLLAGLCNSPLLVRRVWTAALVLQNWRLS